MNNITIVQNFVVVIIDDHAAVDPLQEAKQKGNGEHRKEVKY
jgi:hypothetical protein